MKEKFQLSTKEVLGTAAVAGLILLPGLGFLAVGAVVPLGWLEAATHVTQATGGNMSLWLQIGAFGGSLGGILSGCWVGDRIERALKPRLLALTRE